jgi:signal transduction histidine kinase
MSRDRKSNQRLLIAIISPAILSVILFFMTIFFLALPSMESSLMAQKRRLIREMTQMAWETVNQFYHKSQTGQLTEAVAKAEVIDLLRHMRYGYKSKDYFWINDMHPRIIMHPYRPDLEGADVSDFSDPNGKHLFLEFVRTAQRHGSGFVDYEWQWMDDPERIVPKISFVKEFKPWGWVIGTGIYVDDVAREITAMTKKLALTGGGILVFVAALSLIIIVNSVSVENKRRIAEKEARLQQEQLFQASKMATIGTLAAGVAHEINNPATALSLDIGIIKEVWKSLMPVLERANLEDEHLKVKAMDLKTLCDRTPRLLQHMDEGVGRIQNIVGELKDFSRISPPMLRNDVAINAVVEKAVALLGNILQKSTDSFAVNPAPDLPPFLGNMQKVEQVIVNLLVNAAQALKGKHGRIEISTGYDAASRRVRVDVTDTGVGMTPETLARIGDPFFTTKQSRGNTGLGIAISKRIMEDHGGEMIFASSPERGTRATLFFPVKEQKEPA